ncbi:hypothetical protein MACK_003828 [Theileria orientalis]|uniref:Uncharacterized protein n=1 Tax=Theileria orientalis TaxID=68886 RepID=A0A976SIX8_THEOR|nr:hypothetical protein MACK_003828 [Theileria orientalis]
MWVRYLNRHSAENENNCFGPKRFKIVKESCTLKKLLTSWWSGTPQKQEIHLLLPLRDILKVPEYLRILWEKRKEEYLINGSTNINMRHYDHRDMRRESKILDYPVFALSYADGYLVASGGGGGLTYGICNKLEVYKLRSKFRSEELHLESETTEQGGIVDCLDYNQKAKIWIGSIDDSTLIFAYKPNFGIKIFGRFKTDYITKDPKQNVCKFGHDGHYFVTGGNECCVRVWRLSDKIVKRVKDFHQVKQINKKSGKQKKGYRRKSSNKSAVNGGSVSGPSGDEEDSSSSIDEILVDKKKILHNDVLLTRDESSTDGQSSIDDTSPSPTSIASPIISPSENSGIKFNESIIGLDKDQGALPAEGDPPLVNGKRQARRNKKKADQLCKKVLEYRDHAKPVNDCCIFDDLLVSLSNDCMIFYKLLPVSKQLLKHKDDTSYFKFVKILAKAHRQYSQQDSNSHVYTLLTLEFSNSTTLSGNIKGERFESISNIVSAGKEGTRVTMWNFNMISKKLTQLKSVHISSQKSSSLTIDDTESHFAVGFGDGSVSVYSVENFKIVKRITNHKLPVTDLAFVSKEKLLSAGIDYYVYINEIKKFNFKYYWLLFTLFLIIVSIVAGRYSNII